MFSIIVIESLKCRKIIVIFMFLSIIISISLFLCVDIICS